MVGGALLLGVSVFVFPRSLAYEMGDPVEKTHPHYGGSPSSQPRGLHGE
jgi:hypothetical protein